MEAVIDLRLESTPARKVDSIFPIHADISNEYPKRTDIFKLLGKFVPGQPLTQEESHLGFRYDSVDGKYVLQTRIDGFTLSRLQPYEHWEPFRAEAHRLWLIYRRFAAPLHCIRAAVRYVNRIDIPVIPADMKSYFRTFPEVSPDMPQVMSGHVMQLLMPQENEIMLSLIQASVPPPKPDVVSVNLDLDLYKESATEFSTDERIWDFLDSLRGIRDHIFESCITDRTRALFEPIES